MRANVLNQLAQGAVVAEASSRARVQLTGADARAFLHRMSTQHVKELAPGEGRLNALLTDKGRFVDLVLHLDRGDLGVLLVGSPGRAPALLAWLDRYLFTEKVELADLTGQGGAVEVAGAGAGAVVDAFVAGASSLAPWAFVQSGARLVARDFDRVTESGARVPAFVAVGFDAPPAIDVTIDAADADALRVLAGVPGLPELTDAFTPLDLGMHDAIHWAKGCYIGQEVIARLDTYQKQHKRLVALAAAAPVVTGAAVVVAGATAGVVTSVAGDHALAVAKVPDDGPAHVKAAGDGAALVDVDVRTPPTAQSPHD